MASNKLELVFCDINRDFIDACHKEANREENRRLQEHLNFKFYECDIRGLKVVNAAFLSPANSFGSMGGGIDYVFSRQMFPGINNVVMAKVAQLPTTIDFNTSFDYLKPMEQKPYLPVGEAFITPLSVLGNKCPERFQSCFLITAPTMVEPMEITGTDNAKLAMLATIRVCVTEPKIEQLIVPGLGTGVGCMPETESASQIFQALREFYYGEGDQVILV